VTLRSRDSRDPPVIQYNYFDHDEDWEVMRAGMRLTREIHHQPAFDRFHGRELSSGEDVRSNTEIDDFIRHTEKLFITRLAPVAWALIPWRSWTPSAACTASRVCVSSTPR
jgi:choline dehydrogenase-like flavoprotein